MKRKILYACIAAVAVLFGCSFLVGAEHAVFINDSAGRLNGLLSDNYAIGSSGTEKLGFDNVYVLTSRGVSGISTHHGAGGGGLLYDDGSVKIKSNVIKVGLSFNFNRAKTDTTVEEAAFINTSGEGFAFGYYDNDREFVELDRTEESTVYVFGFDPEGQYLSVFDSEGELLYETTHPNTKANFIALHPLSASEDNLTQYESRKYYGDFEVGYTAGDGFTVINTVSLEQYIKGVIAVEMVAGAPMDAYKAQAVAARSYAQRCIKNTDLYTEYGFDVTNNTYYQAYYGYYVPSRVSYSTISGAVDETANEYLTYNGAVINAMFCAADGGETIDGGYPYLIGVEDPYEGSVWTKGAMGHRIGMSQWGAYAMAKNYNMDYKSILGYYYTGVGISYGHLS